MKSTFFLIAALLLLLCSCNQNAVTGRKQLSLVSESEIASLATLQYKKFLDTSVVLNPATNANAAMVQQVGKRISNAVVEYYKKMNLSFDTKAYQWAYNLVENKLINAWCMPGGKIVVYTGILPITKNADGLAIVMAHEIAHAIALHGKERMSQGLLQQLGGVALSVAISDQPAVAQNIFLSAYGIGSNVGIILPHNRKQELEADKFGLRFAAMAGYNIREAIPLWERMAAAANHQPTAQFLSTHPSEATRIEELSKIMEETIRDYSPKKIP